MEYSGNGLFALFAFIPIILYLAILGFGIYFVIKVIKFINAKTISDRERNAKLDELIQVISKNKNDE
ncbi:hypothetical protein [Lederbergia lenta]|uniref:DUF4083 domain-containing protein n=1 Tax=Lederbergia lenta TaxID=1467 RepID=A0A2X4WP27_LEDLE|nr:hypothetical protein [Lederbergia lenta]MCM3109654.1 hypothetical protein [Lederbergia lenta]MEC2324595.1 hypothetical protein [Lederbergia lenta]SQI59380.1 Uncharacterised protein [Lederbergia lenta]